MGSRPATDFLSSIRQLVKFANFALRQCLSFHQLTVGSEVAFLDIDESEMPGSAFQARLALPKIGFLPGAEC